MNTLLEAALDQPKPSRALARAVNMTLRNLGHPLAVPCGHPSEALVRAAGGSGKGAWRCADCGALVRRES